MPPNLGAQWAQWEGVDLKQWDDLANLLGSEVSRVKVKWMRVKNEIPKNMLQDKSPRVGGSKLSRPKLDTQILKTWHPILGCHWRIAEIQKLSLFTQLVGITIFAA